MTSDGHAQRAVEAVWRDESARIVSALTRHTGDFAWAEDLAQEALVEALATWPSGGIPDNPGAWLMSVAKRRAIDGWRRRERMAQREPLFVSEALHAESVDTVPDEADPDHIDDDVLRLVFVACHPVLPAQARLALTLRTVAGLTTEQIARALLMTVPTVQQRIVRAKRALATEGVPFEVPDRAERPARLASVLQVIYLLFTEGYSATEGEGLVRPDVAREAVRLGRQLAALMPREPEIWSLIALMEFQSSRFAARIDAEGLPLTLEQQDRRRWDRSAIARGNEAIARAVRLAHLPGSRRHGPLSAEASGTTDCRRPSHSATRWLPPSPRPTGSGSSASTTRSTRSLLRLSSDSTAPSRCRWPKAPSRRSSRWSRSRRSCRASDRCPPSGRSSSNASETRMPQPLRSSRPPLFRATTPRRRSSDVGRRKRRRPRRGAPCPTADAVLHAGP